MELKVFIKKLRAFTSSLLILNGIERLWMAWMGSGTNGWVNPQWNWKNYNITYFISYIDGVVNPQWNWKSQLDLSAQHRKPLLLILNGIERAFLPLWTNEILRIVNPQWNWKVIPYCVKTALTCSVNPQWNWKNCTFWDWRFRNASSINPQWNWKFLKCWYSCSFIASS